MLTQKFLVLGRPLLLRACMKLHNACINDRIEEVGSKLSDPAGEEEVPSWDDEEAAAHMPDPESEKTKTEKQRQAQMEKVSKARVLLTESGDLTS
mmetsp:Transcript_3199/g.6260  ORF Transcript_3199/g.6260 Transcript_3199/m.6260 type:complete len:95 (-) Transcript_3199:56-340(-)